MTLAKEPERKFMKEIKFNLQLLAEGGGSDGGGTAAAEGNQNSAQGVGNSAGQVETKNNRNTVSPQEREATFKNLIRGEYKDLFTKETQGIVDRRFKQTKQLEQFQNDVNPLITMLSTKYGTNDVAQLIKAIEDDNSMWEAAADAEGLTVEQYKAKQKLANENAQFRRMMDVQAKQQQARAQYQQWLADAEGVKESYPNFDLQAESENPDFINLLARGVPMKHAYEVIHMDDIKMGVATATQQAVAADVRANGMRPSENGAAAVSGVVTGKVNPSKMSKADRAEMIRRAQRGEIIDFK